MDTIIAQLYSVVDEVFVFVRGSGQIMEIGEVERTVLAPHESWKTGSHVLC